MLSSFSCASWPSVCLLWRNVYLGLLSILDWVVCFFNIELLELFIVFFAMQKLLSFIRSHLFIFVFISISLGGGSKKDLAVIYVKECSAYVFL